MPLLNDNFVSDGPCTAGDYWGLPDGCRAELIGGKLYAMTPPSPTHQKIVFEIARALANHIDHRDGNCEVYTAPFAVNLDANDETWVEPDVLVVCDPGKLSNRGLEGAPDMVVEVVSPSSRRMDYFVKTGRYERAGVREYWIIDPEAQQTTVYRYASETRLLSTYRFDEPVPVGMFEGLSITVGKLP